MNKDWTPFLVLYTNSKLLFSSRTFFKADPSTRVYLVLFSVKISCSAQEQQIWEIILREILNLSLNAKFCISKNLALSYMSLEQGHVFRNANLCIQRQIKNFT